MKELVPEPISAEGFAPFGEVIETADSHREAMNAARFERFDKLARVDTDADGYPAVSIVRCRISSTWWSDIRTGLKRLSHAAKRA